MKWYIHIWHRVKVKQGMLDWISESDYAVIAEEYKKRIRKKLRNLKWLKSISHT
ncbi:hypothetical protein [Bacillus wiedmannii]|uniref:hypothetical protein n=1 Tax=Bacillus wiedmannii TaxID=1890302 RepID=UPI003D995E87